MISRPASGQPYRDALSPAQAKALSEITATHRKRLGEIYLQYYDVSALVDPTVSKMVGLAPTQQKAVQKLFDKAHLKYQEAQEAMFETFRKDGEALRKAAMQDKPSTGNVMKTRISYVMPRRIQNQHTHLSRQVALLQTREMTLARAEVRKLLSANQLARLKSLKGKPISQWFYHGSNWGTAQPHPDLALNINVQAEMGFSLKQYLAIQKEMNELRRNPTKLLAFIASLTPSQRAMLRRYEIQYDREYSVLRHDVAAELGIDAGLADRIRLRIEEIDAEAQRKGGLEWNKLDQPNANEQEIDKARRAILGRADAEKRKAILYMLSASQKAKWRSIVGKPLDEIQPTRHFG